MDVIQNLVYDHRKPMYNLLYHNNETGEYNYFIHYEMPSTGSKLRPTIGILYSWRCLCVNKRKVFGSATAFPQGLKPISQSVCLKLQSNIRSCIISVKVGVHKDEVTQQKSLESITLFEISLKKVICLLQPMIDQQ